MDIKETVTEKNISEVAKTINIALPAGNLPIAEKVIALLTSLGGISIISNLLSGIVRPKDVSYGLYGLQLIIGLAMIAIGYGIIKKKSWVVNLYGLVSIVGLTINPVLAIIPCCITVYLYYRRVQTAK